MLTRIYIDNFKGFVNFEYRPRARQLLLGGNGSGKSSLLEAIRYLKQFLKGDANQFTQSTRTRWLNRSVQVIELQAVIKGQTFEYRLEIEFSSEMKEPRVKAEQLVVDGVKVAEFSAGELRFSASGQSLRYSTDRSTLPLVRLSSREVDVFLSWMDRVHCFKIDVYPSQMDETADSADRTPDFELQNLAAWYRYVLQAQPQENVEFLASLIRSIEGFRTLTISPDEGDDGRWRLRAEFQRGPKLEPCRFSISELSEGQRQLIALYMFLHFLIVRGDTVFVDEPDNFISVGEVQPWLLAAQEAVEDHGGQLILISHHPETLNFWARECGLEFFREENGQVRTREFKPDMNSGLQPAELIARGWQ